MTGAPRLRAAVARTLGHAALLAACAAIAGCRSPIGGASNPLSAGLRARLAAAARPAAAVGLTLDRAGTRYQLAPVWGRGGRAPATLAFSAHAPGPAPLPLVRIRVNGLAVVALVDTGAGGSLMDAYGALRTGLVPLRAPASEKRAGRPGDDTGNLLVLGGSGLGGSFRQFLAVARTVELGGARLTNVPLGIPDRADGAGTGGWLGGQRVEMIIGADLLRQFDTVTVDYRHERLVLDGPLPGAGPGAPLKGVVPVPVVEGELEGYGSMPIAPDTGGDFGLWVPARLALAHHLPRVAGENPVRYGRGVGGPTVATEVGAHRLQVAGSTLEEVPVSLGALRLDRPEPPYALLGLTVLRDRVLTIDFRHGRLWLQP